jgi:6-phosphogluconolactonase
MTESIPTGPSTADTASVAPAMTTAPAEDAAAPATPRALPGGATLVVVPDGAAGAGVAAERIVDALAAGIAARGRGDFVTTGGSTPAAIYRALGTRWRDALPWRAVQLWWGDDRYVPRDHPLSNANLGEQGLLAAAAFSGQSGFGASGTDLADGRSAGIQIPRANVHPIPVAAGIASGGGPAVAAEAYDAELRAAGLETTGGWPVFDVVLVGIGPDGHLLSVFPDSTAWDETAWAVAIPAPTHIAPHVARITLQPAILAAARLVLVVATGAGKAARLAEIVGATGGERQLPARAALRPNATWILDEAAASQLPR